MGLFLCVQICYFHFLCFVCLSVSNVPSLLLYRSSYGISLSGSRSLGLCVHLCTLD